MLRRPRPVAGRYVLLDEIGRGGCGVVHRARDLRLRQYVAAKVARDESARARLAHEHAQRIEHPHVLTSREWVVDDGLALMTMELVPGGTLRDLLARHGPLPERVVAQLLHHLLDALAAVHATGLVHGDVKPANLLLRSGALPHLLLADFGVATTRDRPAPVAGTPSYLPPERVAGTPPHPSQDVYAAGLVARRAMAGPSPLLTLCDSMTRAEPERRPTAAAALRRLRELSGPLSGPS
jgi:eukaryotic-like serine/threonine-protein kinase